MAAVCFITHSHRHPQPSSFSLSSKRLLLVCKKAIQRFEVDNTTGMVDRKTNFCFEFNNGYVMIVDHLKREKVALRSNRQPGQCP